MLSRPQTATRSHVELTPLSDTTWRVCDDRFEAGDVTDLFRTGDTLRLDPAAGVVEILNRDR